MPGFGSPAVRKKSMGVQFNMTPQTFSIDILFN